MFIDGPRLHAHQPPRQIDLHAQPSQRSEHQQPPDLVPVVRPCGKRLCWAAVASSMSSSGHPSASLAASSGQVGPCPTRGRHARPRRTWTRRAAPEESADRSPKKPCPRTGRGQAAGSDHLGLAGRAAGLSTSMTDRPAGGIASSGKNSGSPGAPGAVPPASQVKNPLVHQRYEIRIHGQRSCYRVDRGAQNQDAAPASSSLDQPGITRIQPGKHRAAAGRIELLIREEAGLPKRKARRPAQTPSSAAR